MGLIIYRTHKHSKLAYLYTVAAMMFLAPVFGIISTIFENWGDGCEWFWEFNDQCPGSVKPSHNWIANMKLIDNIWFALGNGCFFVGHWLFAFRYFEVAEMFGRDDKTIEKHESRRRITSKISYFGVSIIVLDYLIYLANYGIYRHATGSFNQ